MDATPQLNARHEQILWATVRHYVATAEPVASRALTQAFDFNVSSATVRNAMGLLEKAGLLFQPHTSAGRVPSDLGYRLYVDRLMHPSQTLAQRVGTQLAQEAHWLSWSLESLLRSVAQMLARLSGYLALVTLPQSQQVVIRHIQLVEVAPFQHLMVVLLDTLTTQPVVIPLPQRLLPGASAPRSHLERLSNFLSNQLGNRVLSTPLTLDWQGMAAELRAYAPAIQDALDELVRRGRPAAPSQLLISGLSEVLRQPEFAESQQVESIVRLLEADQGQLWPLLWSDGVGLAGDRNLRVWIGSENPIEPMQGCAVVLSNYWGQGSAMGRVGVLGPTRMLYEDAVAVVEATADHLSMALSSPQ